MDFHSKKPILRIRIMMKKIIACIALGFSFSVYAQKPLVQQMQAGIDTKGALAFFSELGANDRKEFYALPIDSLMFTVKGDKKSGGVLLDEVMNSTDENDLAYTSLKKVEQGFYAAGRKETLRYRFIIASLQGLDKLAAEFDACPYAVTIFNPFTDIPIDKDVHGEGFLGTFCDKEYSENKHAQRIKKAYGNAWQTFANDYKKSLVQYLSKITDQNSLKEVLELFGFTNDKDLMQDRFYDVNIDELYISFKGKTVLAGEALETLVAQNDATAQQLANNFLVRGQLPRFLREIKEEAEKRGMLSYYSKKLTKVPAVIEKVNPFSIKLASGKTLGVYIEENYASNNDARTIKDAYKDTWDKYKNRAEILMHAQDVELEEKAIEKCCNTLEWTQEARKLLSKSPHLRAIEYGIKKMMPLRLNRWLLQGQIDAQLVLKMHEWLDVLKAEGIALEGARTIDDYKDLFADSLKPPAPPQDPQYRSGRMRITNKNIVYGLIGVGIACVGYVYAQSRNNKATPNSSAASRAA